MKRNYLKTILFVFFGLAVMLSACKKDEIIEEDPNATSFEDDGNGNITVTDKGEGTGDYTFTSDKVWILNGLVFVNEAQTLTIEAGTLIKGKPGTGENASALIVARSGKINAVGTATNPIIFTAEADNAEGTGVDAGARGLWGGLILLGKATTNNLTSDKAVEGIPTSELRGLYGGTDDADNSGTLKYVSIRHGGTDIGEANEINGLTLGAVGSGTTIDYVEIVANNDDGIEFFGGSVMVKHALVVNCKDDSYDYDEGFHGKGQFWVIIHGADSDRGGEHDGGPSDNETGSPYATPVIYNATYIGAVAGESKTVTLRDNAGGTYKNSIFVDFYKGLDIEYLQDDNDNMVQCSYKMWEDNYLNIENNVFYNVAGQTDGGAYDAASLFKISVPKDDQDNPLYDVPQDKTDAWTTAFAGNGNSVADPGISSTNPVPASAQTGNLAAYDSGFENVSYKGAFDNTNWAAGWTLTFK
ncbi:MAG: hypothetical protein K8R54_08670 [Bacteroidales bacterium]|nr:hypothetical protein [Bacteroidales bacterium]